MKCFLITHLCVTRREKGKTIFFTIVSPGSAHSTQAPEKSVHTDTNCRGSSYIDDGEYEEAHIVKTRPLWFQCDVCVCICL